MAQSISRLFQMAGAYKGKMIASVLCSVASVVAGIIPYFIVQQFVVEVLSPGLRPSRLLLLAAIVGMLLICKTTLFMVSTNLSHRAAYRILHNVRVRLANKLTRLPLGYVLERDSGVIKKVMENDVEELERFLAHNIPETISSVAVPVAVLIYLALIDWRMTLAMLSFIPLAALFYIWMMKGSKQKMAKYYAAVDNMNAVVVEYVNGMKEIKAFNQSESSFSRFRGAIEEYRRYVLEWYKSSWPLMTGYYVLLGGTLVTVLPIGLLLYLKGSLAIPVLVLFSLVSMGFAAPLIKVTEFADSIILVTDAERNIHNILSEKELSEADGEQEPQNNTVAFASVDFSYDEAAKVLEGVSFSAKEGQSTALIGPSGSGKSTVAKLICRFWDVAGGEISLGGVDIRQISADKLMERISFVFQDTFLFNLSIADNIRIGKPEATDEEVVWAAKLARCHEFVMKTANGYATLAGDAGSRLSGGERQRICIARAILKDAPVLVLDEATASIDPDSEEQIQEAIGELAKGKTLIVIAHRIRTIMSFDQILVMQEGQIRAGGNHEELLRASPEYRAIYDAYTFTENWTLGKGVKPC